MLIHFEDCWRLISGEKPLTMDTEMSLESIDLVIQSFTDELNLDELPLDTLKELLHFADRFHYRRMV